jgi:hypothetical protein
MSIVDQIKDALFYKAGTTGDNKELDLRKLAGLLGFGLTASGAIDFGPERPAVGYNKPVPKFKAVRNRVQNTYDPNRRPGSGGQYFFTPTEYVRQSDSLFGDDFESYADDLQTAQDAAATQAKGLETLNKENLASYPAPVTTTPEETNTGIASLSSLPINVPTAEQQLAGQVNLGMADGGIVGLSHGGFHLTQPSTWGNAASNLGSNIKNTISNITGVGNPANEGKSFIGADTWTYGANSEGEGGFTLQTPEAALASGDLDQDIYDMHTQTGKYENMRPDGTPRDSNDDKPNSNVYKRPADYSNFTAEQARELIKALAPTTKGYTGDYSDLDTFQSYYFSNPEFQFEDFKQLGEIAGYGKKNKLASDTNIISGAAEGTYRQEGDDPVSTNNTTTDNSVVDVIDTGDDYEFVPVTTIDDQVNAITEYDQYVEDQDIPVVDGYAVFDKNKHTMGGFNIGDGKSNNSIAVYVDDNGVVRYSNGQEFGGPPDVAQSIRDAAGYVPAAPVWSEETYPVATDIFGTIGTVVDTVSESNANAFSDLATNFSYNKDTGNFDTEQQDNIIKMYSDVVNGDSYFAKPDGTADVNYETQSLASIQRQLEFFKALREKTEEEVESFVQELKTWSDFLGTYGQPGAAYGGAIKGYAMGGMGQAPDLPSGLLKSTEDGMADTIPAQMGNQPINLSGGEYIMDAETVAFLGNGNTDAGAQKLDDFRENLRMAKNGGEDQGNQINSENFLGRLQQMGVA